MLCPTRAVIYKLLFFTVAMVGGPIGMYFLTLNTIFRGMFAIISSAFLSSVILRAFHFSELLSVG